MSVLNTFQYKQLEFLAAQLSVDAKMLKTCLSKLHNLCYFRIAHFIHKKTLGPLFIDGVQLPQGYRATMRRQFTFYH